MYKKYFPVALLLILLCACNIPLAIPLRPGDPRAGAPRIELVESTILATRVEQAMLFEKRIYYSNFGLSIGGSSDTPVIAAVEMETGEPVWEIEQKPITGMTSDDRQLYFATESGVTAVRLKDGSMHWQAPISCERDCGWRSELLVGDGRLFYAVEETLYALDVRNGSVLWTAPILGGIDTFKKPTGSDYADEGRALAVDRGVFYLRLGPPWRLLALDSRSGDRLWEFPFSLPELHGEGPPMAASRAAFGEQIVYFSTRDGTTGKGEGKTYALDKGTGQVIWETEDSLDSPLYHNGLILAVTDYQTVGGIEARSGNILWSVPIMEGDIGDLSPFGINNEYLVFYTSGAGSGDNSQITVVDLREGEVVYTLRPIFPKDCAPSSPVAISLQNEILYLATLKCLHSFKISLGQP